MGARNARISVAKLSEIPLGGVLTVTVAGQPPISIFHTDEGLFAIDDDCPHQKASLADGWVENCAVECPLHESCFDLRTGAVSGPPAKTPVRVHRTGVDSEAVWLEISS
ncbi:ferredoxin subunit of nitrite reductase and ring-hydroxylating dioxygenase [Mycobacteroides abscessus subsp. massiliense]|uniref:bifunctional 3-phenylpropionate/cinnamic acid dioxygenase ferredoxin subunit n=1 Tax=Mycobacteroides abscessus TaxID=36809 RepID=UPI0009A5976D|nr:bifunctional 3-phenylpropionate/cinnamic acid dioxygenase ferredoxin subunit [Mycobacteroides abscessus]SKH59382.1 ferredoxin subunit of nitrite reductase and ring-hydroxylating dioxygenase [Mycobacteroides abscessus subsp. massiliense]SKH93121.1 ferredoxin subunit of nitrite reductase and ring-hydroxylating dioxygenase [Mycobacteroides abscessus subsp. massiliense]SKI13289.1 ferredoxin subunit of nitrite reductase and ring-hydroxylating dioxygenase [Mycobacteroides abscessus subsp. massilien